MLILCTSEESNSAEKEQLTQIFEAGLSLLHVRKPGMSEEELRSWLMQFQGKYIQRMVLHQHHQLAEKFPVKGIHLKEQFREDQEDLEGYIDRFRSMACLVSSSFHDPITVKNKAEAFDYVILSPVFTSISKKGHKGKVFNVKALTQKIIALGGIEKQTISQAKDLGYAGVAVLGAVWRAKNKQKAFAEIYEEYRNVYQ